VVAPDVAIVGGGIVGTSIAVELASRGLRVVLHERARVAAGASGRNSGAIWHPSDPVLAALYAETLAAYRALPPRLEALLPGGHGAREFRLPATPAGLLALGADGAALRATADAEAAAHPELAPRFFDPGEVQALEPGVAGGLAAVRYDIGFPVEPAAATQTMAALAVALGVDLREGSAVRAIARDGARAAGLVTGNGTEAAGAVVVAAGPWSPALVDPSGRWRPILPFWGVVVELALAAAPRHVLEAAPEADGAAPEADGLAPEADGLAPEAGFSLVTAAGRSALGSTFLPDEPDPWAWEPALRERGSRYVPAIGRTATSGVRACARPVSLDGRPLAGPVPGTDGLFIAAGHGPWGMSTGVATAAHVAALVAGEPDPRPPEVLAATGAGRFGGPWG
jgi:D-hydroxyproline dehydrogenase subunit beta